MNSFQYNNNFNWTSLHAKIAKNSSHFYPKRTIEYKCNKCNKNYISKHVSIAVEDKEGRIILFYFLFFYLQISILMYGYYFHLTIVRGVEYVFTRVSKRNKTEKILCYCAAHLLYPTCAPWFWIFGSKNKNFGFFFTFYFIWFYLIKKKYNNFYYIWRICCTCCCVSIFVQLNICLMML